MKTSFAGIAISLIIASCSTETRNAYIGEADLENFGRPQAFLSLVNVNGSDSMSFTLDAPRWSKSTTTNTQWYGIRRSVRETESYWYSYASNQGYGNIHIGLSPEEITPDQSKTGNSILQIQVDFSGGSFFRVYSRHGGILPESPDGEINVTHTPADTIHINGRSFTGYYRIIQPEPLPVWKVWKAVWIKPGQVPAALESADGMLYMAR
jgi:hypothetical protein